jgi:hypothetical protein
LPLIVFYDERLRSATIRCDLPTKGLPGGSAAIRTPVSRFPPSNYLSRDATSGVYQVTQLLPPEGEAFQYRIKNANEPHERVAKESELRSA